ncbi:MAG: GNAT family N-acetyltransferase [Chloroflexota bacterium]
MNDLTVVQRLDESQRRRAAEILYHAFRHQYGPLLRARPPAVALFASALRPERIVSVLARGELVGLAGLEYEGRRSLVFRWADAIGLYGLLGGALRASVLVFTGSSAPPGEMLVAHLAVAEGWRGRGVGTRLLAEVFAIARARGCTAVRLRVLDTNLGARRLYERLGFCPVDTLRLPFLFRLTGFSAVITMVKHLDRPTEQP